MRDRGAVQLSGAALARQEPSCEDQYHHHRRDHQDNRSLATLRCLLRVKHDTSTVRGCLYCTLGRSFGVSLEPRAIAFAAGPAPEVRSRCWLRAAELQDTRETRGRRAHQPRLARARRGTAEARPERKARWRAATRVRGRSQPAKTRCGPLVLLTLLGRIHPAYY
jgi:hypothetical protein